MHGLVFHGLIGLKCSRCKFFSKHGHCLLECSCYYSPMFWFCTAFKWSSQERLNENDSSRQYSWKHPTVLNLNQPVIHKLSVKMCWMQWSHFWKGSLITNNHTRKGYSISFISSSFDKLPNYSALWRFRTLYRSTTLQWKFPHFHLTRSKREFL